jgi:glycosyltransferase involved in cell wall biosynthesis
VSLPDALTRAQRSELRLVVDLQTAQGGFFGDRGIRRYAMSLTSALLRRGAVSAVLFNPNRPTVDPIPTELADTAQVEWSSTPTLRRLDAAGATAYLMTSPFERVQPPASFLPRFVVDSGMPVAAVLYDLIPEIIDVYPAELMEGYRVRRELIKHVDLILALSDQTKRDAIDRLGVPPERVQVIGAGASEYFRPRAAGDQPALLLAERLPQITKPYVFCVSGWSAHKNTEGLIDAWARLPTRTRDAMQLVVTCRLPPQAGTAWVDRARTRGLRDGDLVVTDYVDDEVLRALYQQAHLLVTPSFYEGFGLPVLEAALCECPAVTSNAAAVPEVLQWAPSSFSPGDLDEMAHVIERGVHDEEFRLQLRHAGDAATRRHTWERVAEQTESACARLAAARVRHRAPRLRLALVGAFDSPRDERVAREIGAAADVECFAAVEGRPAATRRHGIGLLGRVVDPWGYDAVVYLVDERTPPAVLDAARRYPGIVWFLAHPAACPDAPELSRGVRGRLVPQGAEAPNAAASVAPFARPASTRVAALDDLDAAVTSTLELVRSR